jgi:hypothetical protein
MIVSKKYRSISNDYIAMKKLEQVFSIYKLIIFIDFLQGTHERTGRPLGNSLFIGNLEIKLGRKFSLNKPGPKPKNGKENNK